MIKVVFESVEDEVLSVTIKGHAYSGEPGHDLVCAGVSSVTIGALNSLEESETAFDIKIDEGYMHVLALYRLSAYNKIVLTVLKKSLLTIEESYGKYIKIREERKN